MFLSTVSYGTSAAESTNKMDVFLHLHNSVGWSHSSGTLLDNTTNGMGSSLLESFRFEDEN